MVAEDAVGQVRSKILEYRTYCQERGMWEAAQERIRAYERRLLEDLDIPVCEEPRHEAAPENSKLD